MTRSFNVLYRFLAKDSFSGVSQKIKSGNKKLGTSFKRLDKDVKKSGTTFKKTSRNFIGGFKGMAVAALSFFSIKGFIETGAQFQDALADLSAITGATGEDLDKLKNKTLAMAKASVTSQADVAEAIKLVASAKPELLDNIDALTATTDAVLLLKNAAGIELADAANITAQGLNIFGASADQASRFVNVLAAGAKLGSSEIADTGAALLIAGPGARAAGLSFEQLNAAIQTVAKGGIKGAQAGTALNAIFGRMRRLGIDFKKVGLEGAFNLIKTKLDSTTNSTTRAKLEAKIFGEEHAKVGLAILDNARLLTQYEGSLRGTNIAQEQADIRLNTFNSRFRKLGIIIKDVVIKTFLRLEPVISKQVVAFTNFLETIDPKHVEAFGDALGILVNAAVIIAKGFKIVLAILKGIGTAIGELAAQIVTLNFDVDIGTGFKEAFSIGGKFLGVFGDDIEPEIKPKFIAPKDSKLAGLNSKFLTDNADLIQSAKSKFAIDNALKAQLTASIKSKFAIDSALKSPLTAPIEPVSTGAPIGDNSTSTTDVNVNLNAPKDVIQSVQSKTTGGRNANVGINMANG